MLLRAAKPEHLSSLSVGEFLRSILYSTSGRVKLEQSHRLAEQGSRQQYNQQHEGQVTVSIKLHFWWVWNKQLYSNAASIPFLQDKTLGDNSFSPPWPKCRWLGASQHFTERKCLDTTLTEGTVSLILCLSRPSALWASRWQPFGGLCCPLLISNANGHTYLWLCTHCLKPDCQRPEQFRFDLCLRSAVQGPCSGGTWYECDPRRRLWWEE